MITPIDAPEAFRAEAVQSRDAEMDTPALGALGLAHHWQHLLDTGRLGSLTQIAAAEGMDLAQVSRIARLAWVGSISDQHDQLTPKTRYRSRRLRPI